MHIHRNPIARPWLLFSVDRDSPPIGAVAIDPDVAIMSVAGTSSSATTAILRVGYTCFPFLLSFRRHYMIFK